MIYLRNLKIYSYPNLPINRQGIINKDGDFISFYPIDKETFSENSIKEFMEEFYNIDINSILEEKELYHEFNISVDPLSAKLVFDSPFKDIKVVTHEAGIEAYIDDKEMWP